MKKLIFIFLCFSISLVYSQIGSEINLYKGENLYIEMPSLPKHQLLAKNIRLETYLIEIGAPCNGGKKIRFEVLPSGKLSRHIIIPGCSTPTIEISYLSKNDDNKLTKIDKTTIQNFITYEELKNSSIDNLLWVFSQFKNVYILNNKNEAKKVQVTQLPSL